MHVEIHKLFQQFQTALARRPQASIVESLTEPPKLGDFMDRLDPNLRLDWSGQSFHGLPSLRHKVLQRMELADACSIDDVLITAGTAEANFLAIMQLVQPGDEMIVDTPGWPQPLVLANAIGAKLHTLPRDESRGWAIDLDQLANLIGDNTRLVFLCNPNNPTGHLIPVEELRKVVQLVDRVGAYLLTDEVYRGLEWGEEKTPSSAALYERGISTGSVSKVLGLQGIRIGWLVCRDPAVITDAIVLREDSSEIMNIMGEAIADIALGDDYYPDAISRARQTGRHNLELIDRLIQAQAALDWQRPAAGLIGFARLQLDISADEFSARLLDAPYDTFVMPGSAYDRPQHLRLGGGGTTARLEDGLQRLGNFLATLQ
ncbi:MAG: aminotransferase class I/II-fold pyridoxal phosphate-dependent enzyme [Gammaproteobacteria bacterium]|nr:aminotransferase class I/II-fold pyridoxal phosphate-dependent enzyme [Gammaproteobacteria bacterium]